MYAVFAIAIMCFLNTITAHIAAREWMARPMAYESPIELFVQDLNWKIEGEIASADLTGGTVVVRPRAIA